MKQWLAVFLTGIIVITTQSAPAALQVTHLAASTAADAGRSRVIAFHVNPAPASDTQLPAAVNDHSIASVISPPTIGAGSTIGYLRILAHRPGRTRLSIDGASIDLVVRGTPTVADQDMPVIVGLTSGACVWGETSFGVEVPGGRAEDMPDVRIELSDGTRLEPRDDTLTRFQPYRQLHFTLDVTPHPPGALSLTPVLVHHDGSETIGSMTTIRVIHPEPGALLEREAEERYDGPRPQRFEDDRMRVGWHKDASGGRYFMNASANPAVCLPITITETGWYQMMVVAGGTRAQGVLPTIGIVVDGSDRSVTNGRLVDEHWHRIALGVPFRLEPGKHLLTPYFANDFHVERRADRNLMLDRIEVARIADAQTEAEGATDDAMASMAMTSMSPMAMVAGGAAMSLVGDDPYGRQVEPLRIALSGPLHGQIIPGSLEVEARAWWADNTATPAPVVQLMVNGREVGRQRSGAPRFWIDASAFNPGVNTIQLVARLDSGAVARTPLQEMTYPPQAAVAVRPNRHHHRFTIHEPQWTMAHGVAVGTDRYPKERIAWEFASSGEAVLDVPADLEGDYEVFVEAAGVQGSNDARLEVLHRTERRTSSIKRSPFSPWWDTRSFGTTRFESGPKQLIIRVHEPEEKAGAMGLQSVILAERASKPEKEAPYVAITYPKDGARMHLADAVVVEASDNASLASMELIIDGINTGHTININGKPGRHLLPLLLRDLSPGPHTIEVEAIDRADNSARSQPRTFVVTETAPDEPRRYARAVHLLERFAYGPDPNELADILTMGEHQWLDDRLSTSLDVPGDLAAFSAGFPYFVNRYPYEVSGRVVSHLLLTPNPVRARFSIFMQNHFSTWVRKAEGDRKWAEHVEFTRLGPTTFDRLLQSSASSPAMLTYLDQASSFAGRINENYAREVMELHTLGVHGGYTQTDVTSLARLLTGWSTAIEGDGRGGGPLARRHTHRFDPELCDGASQRLLGMPFAETTADERYDRIEHVLELLAAHPSTARFVAGKMVAHYVGLPADEEMVNDLAQTFARTGGDTAAMLRAIAQHPGFWESMNNERMTTPIDYSIRLCRSTQHYQPWLIGDYLRRSGNDVFDRPTPDGYPEEDAAYSDSNAMIQRWKLAEGVKWQLANLVPGPWRYDQRVDDEDWQQRIVDLIAVRLTGHTLDPRSNEAALQVIRGATGDSNLRTVAVAPFIAKLPEANVR